MTDGATIRASRHSRAPGSAGMVAIRKSVLEARTWDHHRSQAARITAPASVSFLNRDALVGGSGAAGSPSIRIQTSEHQLTPDEVVPVFYR